MAACNIRAVDCLGQTPPERTDITFEVTDTPKYLVTCGLGDTQLIIKKLWGFCDGHWAKEVPIKDACGKTVLVTECQPEHVILMPGHYRIEIENCPGEAFPEDFDHELYGIPFEFAKCWFAQRSNA